MRGFIKSKRVKGKVAELTKGKRKIKLNSRRSASYNAGS
jgi:hypothetical protein